MVMLYTFIAMVYKSCDFGFREGQRIPDLADGLDLFPKLQSLDFIVQGSLVG